MSAGHSVIDPGVTEREMKRTSARREHLAPRGRSGTEKVAAPAPGVTAWDTAAMHAPQPWSQVPAARLRPLRGVLTDIDDTLTRDGAIDPPALAALLDLRAAAIPVIAITGRPAGWSETFARSWPVAAIVAENGAVMLRGHGDGVQRDFVADAATRQAQAQRLAACAQDVLARVPGATLARDSAGRLTDIAIDHSEFTTLTPDGIDAVAAVMRHHGLTATVSSIHINGWLGAHDKFSGARWAVETALGLPFDPTEWLFVGDSSNDQVMFERVPVSVGVANVARFLPTLRTPPAWITAGERGAGFAEVAAALQAARNA